MTTAQEPPADHGQLQTPAPIASAFQESRSAVVVACVGLCWMITATAALQIAVKRSGGMRGDIVDTIDPNTAPWTEMTALPGIGPGRARAIVAYRQARLAENGRASSRPAFARRADLQLVKGIGPKTIQRIAPYVRVGTTRSEPRP